MSVKPLRVGLQQPALPEYRIPFFQALSEDDRIELSVFFGSVEAITNVGDHRLNATFQQTRRLPLGFLWNGQQLRVLDRKRFDVVVYSANIHYLSFIVGLFLSRLKGIPVVAWGHFRSKNENRLRRRLRRFFTRFADCLLCYDDRGKSELVGQGISAERVFVSPNSVDVDGLAEAHHRSIESGQARSLAEELNLVAGKTLIFASRLVSRKRVDFLLSTFALVVRDEPDARLIIVGDGPERQELEGTARSLGVAERTHFVGETFDQRRIATYFAVADLMLYPTNLGL
ncbi:MAG: glycosyltransferase, partial [Planctomycetota bacterium]